MMESQPKSTTASSLGLIRFSRSKSLGPTNSEKRLAGLAETAVPGKGAGFSSNSVRTVSLKVITCMVLPASGRKTAAKYVSAMPANEKSPLEVMGPSLAALAFCSTSLLSAVLKYSVRCAPEGLATVRSPNPPRHSIRFGIGLPSTVTSELTCER